MLFMFLVEGFEETEAVATLDVIRRANLEVQTVSENGIVLGSHKIEIKTDTTYNKITFEGLTGVILPGGPGTFRYLKNKTVIEFIKHCNKEHLLLAAICAAPTVLAYENLLENKNATCFPKEKNNLMGANYLDQKTVRDDNIITSKAMGTSMEFGLAIVSYFEGEEKASAIKESIFLG